jgi:hypothetical protein
VETSQASQVQTETHLASLASETLVGIAAQMTECPEVLADKLQAFSKDRQPGQILELLLIEVYFP